MKKIFKILGIIIFFVVLTGVSLKLFAPDLIKDWQKKINDRYHPLIVEDHVLSIAYSDNISSLEPTSYEVPNRNRLLNIYEGLVKIDKNLNIEPGLALSWGTVDERTWEFSLRPNVLFHDKTTMTAADVKTSFERAMNFQNSQIKNLVSSVESVKIISDQKIQVLTKNPDPLLLNKIASVYIFPAKKMETLAKEAVGTGPYKLTKWGNDNFQLELFPDYWSALPRYRYVNLQFVPDKETRISLLLNNKTDILGSVPFVNVPRLNKAKFQVHQKPSLEINFLAFNLEKKEGNIWSNKKLREAVALTIDKKELLALTRGYAEIANQFVSREIFGYNQNIKQPQSDPKKAKKLVQEVEPFLRLKTTLDLSAGLESFGEYLQKKLSELPIDVELIYHKSPEEFYKKIQEGQCPFFFLGWRSELGDSGDFLQAFIHSRTNDGRYGLYNGGIYNSKTADKLIEESDKILNNPVERSKKLQETMKYIIEDDLISVPLFETSVIYGISPTIDWEPRIDGYIFAAEVK